MSDRDMSLSFYGRMVHYLSTHMANSCRLTVADPNPLPAMVLKITTFTSCGEWHGWAIDRVHSILATLYSREDNVRVVDVVPCAGRLDDC